jgi:hypothetical protein
VLLYSGGQGEVVFSCFVLSSRPAFHSMALSLFCLASPHNKQEKQAIFYCIFLLGEPVG